MRQFSSVTMKRLKGQIAPKNEPFRHKSLYRQRGNAISHKKGVTACNEGVSPSLLTDHLLD